MFFGSTFESPLFWLIVFIGLLIPGTIRNGFNSLPTVTLKLSFGLALPSVMYLLFFVMLIETQNADGIEWVAYWRYWHLAAAPLVIWASICWYSIEILNLQHRQRHWLQAGMGVGALLALINIGFALYISLAGTMYTYNDDTLQWLVNTQVIWPLLVFMWYSLRTGQLLSRNRLERKHQLPQQKPIKHRHLSIIVISTTLLWLALGFMAMWISERLH